MVSDHLQFLPLPSRFQAHHYRQRLKLDLDVEANPIESKFSSSLMDLMQREEAAVAQGRHEFVENASRKVMNGLCAETNKHCGLQSASNQSRWRKLFEEQSEERQQMFHESFTAAGVAYNDRSRRGAGGARRGEQSLEEAFEAEEERLELDAFINYGKYETFNLDNAFGLQLARVDAEWAVYEQQMVNDYESQKAAILGKKGRGGVRGATLRQGETGRARRNNQGFSTRRPCFRRRGGLGGGGGLTTRSCSTSRTSSPRPRIAFLTRRKMLSGGSRGRRLG